MKDKTGKELSGEEVVNKGFNRIFNIMIEFEVFLLHVIGHIPSHTIRYLYYRMAGIKMGRGSVIHTGARFYEPSRIEIGEDSIIGEKVVLDGRAPLKIGNHVDIASEVMIYNSQHDVESEHFSPVTAPVVIEDYVFIGPRAIILPGVTVGKGAVVAAGAIVTKNVMPFEIVAGVPAKSIGERKQKELNYKLGRARLFR